MGQDRGAKDQDGRSVADITNMDQSESASTLGLSDEIRLSVLDNLADGVYFVDRHRRITYWNRGAERLTGFAAHEVFGRRCRDGILNHCDSAGTELCGARCPLVGTMQDGQVREIHVYLHHKTGYRLPVCVRAAPLRDESDRIIGAVEIFHDDTVVVDTRRRVADLERASLTDALTDLGNRRLGEMTLTGWLAQHQQFDWQFGILIADVDHFKAVNDCYGHDAGDAALRIVAGTMAHFGRQGDCAVRWGGDEFVVLVADADPGGLRADAECLRALVSESTVFQGDGRIPLTVSIGGTVVALGDSATTMVRRADGLLYAAKKSGRNRVVIDPA